MTTSNQSPLAAEPAWQPARPKFRPAALILAWILSAAALLAAAWIVPGAHVNNFWGALAATAVIAVLNALLPPIVAALRLPLMLVLGLLLVLVLDALMLLAADRVTGGDLSVDSFWSALGVALVASAVGVVLDVIFGTNDDDTYTFRVIQRIARRSGELTRTDAPGIIFLEIDGLALPVLQRAMRDGNAPNMARWLQDGSHELAEWETDLSSQTGASQAGILLGSNENIPAFRWVVKESATLVACSGPADCAEIERTHSTGRGLLANGGASRGNLLSGEADHVILTVSRMDAEKQANPGYRAFFANGFNVVRDARPLLLGGHPRAVRVVQGEASGRPAARSPRRDLSAPARGDVRLRPRPDRLRRPHGHDERQARRLRDVLELRRGRAPLGPRARGHAGGAAEARPAVRPDRPGAGLRGAAVRDRRPLRPRADAGRDVQAAERLRAGRPRRAVALGRRPGGRDGRRRRAERDGRPRARRRRPARRRSGRRTTSRTARSSCSAPGTSGSST